ncbi:hypothetical protein PVAND_011260 [Polypedilum vanderplanki]|uniref:Uncharacterized protein n=1 Tax=Polypedilum vanderplanki TaxID=319348 RepID=A0A9J6CIR4_POLVA|nr:hypothetical protein PVAND_011260 [Polypedilum vanderplanki]
MKSFPIFHRILIDNAMKNKLGNRSNTYSNQIKKISSFLLIRDNQRQYEFFHENLNLPHLSTIHRFINDSLSPLIQSSLDFDGLRAYLVKNNLKSEVSISEDGIKVDFIYLS